MVFTAQKSGVSVLRPNLAVRRRPRRRTGIELEPRAPGTIFDRGDPVLRRTLIGLRIVRRLRRCQVLVIEEGAAERAHEKIVAEREASGELGEAQIPASAGIVAHHQCTAVAPGDEAVVAAAIDLHLVVIEEMHQVARDEPARERFAGRRAQRKWRIRKSRDRVFP
jgi:hypothetical protein